MLDVTAEFDLPPDRVWLGAAHQGPMPKRAIAAAIEAIRWKQHPHELAAADRFSVVPAALRSAIATLLDVPARQMTLGNSGSYGLHVIANGLGLGAGDEVIVAANDFPSDILPWMRLEQRGVKLVQLEPKTKVLTADEVSAAITPQTKVVCITWVHSFSGQLTDLDAVGEVCRDAGVLCVVNGTQGIGAIPLAPAALPIEALITVGFKWLCGPYGTGFLWMTDEMADRVETQKLYWLGAMTSADLAKPHLDLAAIEPPEVGRHDIFGTANFINSAAMTASIELITEVGVDAIYRHNLALAAAVVDGIDPEAYEVADRGEADRLSSLLFLRPLTETLDTVGARLAEHKVDIAMRRGMIRVAPHLYNTMHDVERLLTALEPHR